MQPESAQSLHEEGREGLAARRGAAAEAAFESRPARAGSAALLRDFWYLAAASARLKPGKTLGIQLLGEPIVLARSRQGAVFALRDICPHRGIPLRHGYLQGEDLVCCYHGWSFSAEGRCTSIPSLVEEQKFDVSRVKVHAYPCREVQGNLWVYVGDREPGEGPDPQPAPPQLPGIGERAPAVALCSGFPCDADQAAFGLMDPTHAAFVHTSWWWKKQARKLRQKQKEFEPAPLGWRMKRHQLPKENRAYRVLGQTVTTEITYRLPGIRIEHIQGDRHTVVGLTAITPLNEKESEVHQCLYWTLPWLGLFTPLVRRLAWAFLMQDREVVVQQQEGLSYDPNLMLINDADTQARWYYQLKQEWQRARAENRPFANPIQPRTLRWRS
jgi:phenylpropionate dioxygenase-like ring-hydroxylating dioxygenase large terminal subunit